MFILKYARCYPLHFDKILEVKLQSPKEYWFVRTMQWFAGMPESDETPFTRQCFTDVKTKGWCGFSLQLPFSTSGLKETKKQ